MKKKYFSSVAATLLLTVGILGACSKDDDTGKKETEVSSNFNETGMPIVDEKIKIDGFAAKLFSSQNWNDLMLWNEYEKMTNIEVNWETVSTEVLAEKRNLKLAAGDYPEIFFASALPKTDLIKYGEQGVFVPLNDYIDKYAPNFKAILEEFPAIEAGITMADGNIYGFPAIYDPAFDALRASTPWINGDWLKKLDLDPPETPDELFEVLKAFKDGDPNGNGKADELGWGGRGIGGFINYLRGTYGLNKQGSMNINLDFKEGTEEFRFVPSTDEYKEILVFLNKLYNEGLISQDIFTMEPLAFDTLAGEGNFGMLNTIDPATGLQIPGYEGVPVLEGPTGERSYNTVSTGLGNLGMFVVTEKAKNPEALVRWIDHFYGEEGNKMFFMGFEGVTYEENEDGTVSYTENITDNKDGLNLDQAVSEYLTWPGGYYPGIVRQKYFQGAEGKEASTLNAAQTKPYRIKDEDIIPGLNYTLQENDEVSAIVTDLQTFVDEMTADFVTGKQDFKKWDEYKATLEKMGVNKYLEISQEAYERMKENQ